MDIAIIPAYDPDQKLIELIKDLHLKGIQNIIVINDGSSTDSNIVFHQISSSVTLLTHEENKGKGAAIKTALKYIINNINPHTVDGIVILDADGQHRPVDAIRLLNAAHETGSGLVLGVRCFDEKIPIKSLFGNTLTKYVFRLCSGKWVSDTQTGLRAFSMDMVPELLDVSGERYEYEMNVLLTLAKKKIAFTEVPIATIYHDSNNSCSHFRAVRDSVRIYGNILAFSGASFLSFLLDYILFFLFVRIFDTGLEAAASLVYANVSARLISAAFNYYLNSTFIFKHKDDRLKSMVSYAFLACLILALNTILLYGLNDYLGLDKAIAKLITELTLFGVSFVVQKFFIFNKKRHTNVMML
ncbi:bifunctional glycosyltransferase family 2/GtrA family protein [Anaeromicropila herbilytica]|uniref:Glycosyl transferase n=1 Tax=Anaeromicropila herbilytica TaxID=2785025 RepID=A0A7R7EPZ5_9FIRM|nr:bifunctional glycosyltransferase family 2/GtrA family protein [Anaeromicropila herbilytica]BCN32878.1 glycosyl transferase [Anaeromicropila herbilytica]